MPPSWMLRHFVDLLLDAGFQLSVLIRGIHVVAILVLMLWLLSWFSNCCPDAWIVVRILKLLLWCSNCCPYAAIIFLMLNIFSCCWLIFPDAHIFVLLMSSLSWSSPTISVPIVFLMQLIFLSWSLSWYSRSWHRCPDPQIVFPWCCRRCPDLPRCCWCWSPPARNHSQRHLVPPSSL